MAAKRAEGLPRLVLELVHQPLRQDHRACRRSPAAKRLAQRDNVRPALGTLELKPPAGPSEPGDDLIRDPKRTGALRCLGHSILVRRVVVNASLPIRKTPTAPTHAASRSNPMSTRSRAASSRSAHSQPSLTTGLFAALRTASTRSGWR